MNAIESRDLYVPITASIREVIATIDRSARLGIALVVDDQERLVNTLTDGDVRRGILAGFSLDGGLSKLLEIKKRMPHPLPVFAPANANIEQRIAVMRNSSVRQLPIVDHDGRVIEIESLNDLLGSCRLPLNAVVMAGGFGKRLHPLTQNTPKPMLLVGGRPVLEHIIEKLSRAGIHQLHVTTHFMPEKIVEHFGDGRTFGVDISYLNEDSPLGTAGAIGMMPKPNEDVLVVNGDIISEVDFVAMYDFHREHRAAMTLGVQPYEHKVPFGVVELDGETVTGISEKPCYRWFVNAGIYILSPEIFDLVTPGERLDMPELIARVLSSASRVVSFPLREKWIDIGQHADYERAQREVEPVFSEAGG